MFHEPVLLLQISKDVVSGEGLSQSSSLYPQVAVGMWRSALAVEDACIHACSSRAPYSPQLQRLWRNSSALIVEYSLAMLDMPPRRIFAKWEMPFVMPDGVASARSSYQLI